MGTAGIGKNAAALAVEPLLRKANRSVCMCTQTQDIFLFYG